MSLGVIQVQVLIGYTMIVEVIFNWPGLGTEIVNSILQRDYAVAEVLSLMLAGVVVFVQRDRRHRSSGNRPTRPNRGRVVLDEETDGNQH